MTKKDNENWSTKELVNYLSQSNEALRIENSRLLDEVERLTMNIEVHDAQIVCNTMGGYYEFLNNFNYTLKNK
jgi:predicted esterase YcpF (UPF0227 family)